MTPVLSPCGVDRVVRVRYPGGAGGVEPASWSWIFGAGAPLPPRLRASRRATGSWCSQIRRSGGWVVFAGWWCFLSPAGRGGEGWRGFVAMFCVLVRWSWCSFFCYPWPAVVARGDGRWSGARPVFGWFGGRSWPAKLFELVGRWSSLVASQSLLCGIHLRSSPAGSGEVVPCFARDTVPAFALDRSGWIRAPLLWEGHFCNQRLWRQRLNGGPPFFLLFIPAGKICSWILLLSRPRSRFLVFVKVVLRWLVWFRLPYPCICTRSSISCNVFLTV